MPDYRVYIVGADGHFFGYQAIECADDEMARERAAQLVDGHDVEFWQRDRQVAKFERKPKIRF